MKHLNVRMWYQMISMVVVASCSVDGITKNLRILQPYIKALTGYVDTFGCSNRRHKSVGKVDADLVMCSFTPALKIQQQLEEESKMTQQQKKGSFFRCSLYSILFNVLTTKKYEIVKSELL